MSQISCSNFSNNNQTFTTFFSLSLTLAKLASISLSRSSENLAFAASLFSMAVFTSLTRKIPTPSDKLAKQLNAKTASSIMV